MKTFRQDLLGEFIEKSPDANLDYANKWADWLVNGDAISTSEWSAEAGVTLTIPRVVGKTTSVFIDGGVAGNYYKVTNLMLTVEGRRVSTSFRVLVTDSPS